MKKETKNCFSDEFIKQILENIEKEDGYENYLKLMRELSKR